MNRRSFFKHTALGTTALLARKIYAAEKTAPQLSDELILSITKEQIQKHRVGKGSIHVRDAAGKSIRHAKIKIEQLRHEFLFGANFFIFNRCGDPLLEEQYRDRFRALLNYATLGFYWADYERERGQPRYGYTDEVLKYCGEHQITCKGHPLVWDHEVSTPPWLPSDLNEVKALSQARVSEIVSRYKGRIDIWDVVNEATHLTEIKKKSRMDELGLSMGQVEYVAAHLKLARAANPNALLLVNDYKTSASYYDLLNKLRENEALFFDTVGIQSHMHKGLWPLKKVWDVCDTFAGLGLPIHFTETTIVSGKRVDAENWGATNPEDEEKQAQQVVNFYTALFAHPAVRAITWWDFSDLGAWQGAPAGWLRRDMSPKPVYDRLMALFKGEWWTKIEGDTGVFGNFGFSGFYGDYRATVILPNGERFEKMFSWRRDKTERVAVTI